MKIQQFVMAYGVEQDRLRAILPEGLESLRPVLRVNAELWDDTRGMVEFNTAVSRTAPGTTPFRGWLNIGCWQEVPFTKTGELVVFRTELLELSFRAIGLRGGCPAEKDNQGCIFFGDSLTIRPPEQIDVPKEFCDCTFRWWTGVGGKSIGKTLPALPTEVKTRYPKQEFTVENAASIPCDGVLGTYTVIFDRK